MYNVVLITGATGGIGKELSRVFAKNKHDLILTSTSEEQLLSLKSELEKEYGVQITCIQKDLTIEGAVDELYYQIKELKFDVEILCNNAGFGDYGHFFDAKWEKLDKMIKLNITSLTRMCQLFGADMERRGYGKIMNTSSIAAFQPGPLMAVYFATKSYVLSFTEALREEMHKSGVHVMALCPGITNTKFWDESGAKESRLVNRIKPAQPQELALFAYKKLMKNRAVAIHLWRSRFLIFTERFFPRLIVRKVVKEVQEKRRIK